VNRVVDDDQINAVVVQTAERIASMPEAAVAAAKRAVGAAHGDPDHGYAVEAEAFRGALNDGARARMRRFLELGGQTRDGERDIERLLDRVDRA
jgi:hypothetical protein